MAPHTRRLEVIVSAARAAGESLMRDFAHPERVRVQEKGPSDFVSSADLRSQEVACRYLLAAYPDHDVLVEEDSAQGPSGNSARFIVDPLDGTTNFLRGIPHFAVSIALEIEGEVVAGAVFDPAKNELFCAEAGLGGWLGTAPLAVSRERMLSRTVVGTGVPHHGSRGHAEYLAALARVMPAVAGIRRLGAAALDLAYVAAGRFDAFFERGLAPWDVAAGSLLVREAGGAVTKSDGAAMALTDRDVLATSGEPLHGTMVAMLAPLHEPPVPPVG
jgi:myo-inositol-1(or 4)-monophosphatase